MFSEKSADEHFQIGNKARLERNDHQKALYHYGKCEELNPSHPYVYSHRAWSKRATGDLAGGIQDLEKAVRTTVDRHKECAREWLAQFRSEQSAAARTYPR